MPQKRCALGLERLCLMRISKSLEKYWYRPFEEQFGNTSRLLHVIGPFDHISSELIQKVIDVLVEYKIFNPKYLQLMFSSHLIQLDLSKASIRQNNVVDTIGIRCYNLTRLTLKHCSGLSNKSLVSMVTCMKKLQHLNLASTKSDNQVLVAIANNCRDLVTLDVAYTNIQTLQPLLSHDLEPPIGTLPCSKLQCVDFYMLMIPLHQVVQFLTQRYSFLTDFIFDNIVETIDNFSQSEIASSLRDLGIQNSSGVDLQETFSKFDAKHLKIRTLNCDMSHCSATNLHCLYTTVLMCPNVTSVMLTNVSDYRQLLPLQNLSNLCKLSVNLCQEGDADGLLPYDSGIKPVLEKQGNRIISLQLYGFPVVDILSIADLCQNIKRIELPYTKLAPLGELGCMDKPHFRMLQEFLHQSFEDEEMDRDEVVSPLSFILEKASALRYLKLEDCAELDDSVITKVTEGHSFLSLEVLNLTRCNSITSDSIANLLLADNNLKEVILNNCWQIHNADFRRYKQLIKQNNFDVDLFWV